MYPQPNKIFDSVNTFGTDSTYPIFVSLYTINNGYEKYAFKLIESMDKFNLPYYIEGLILDRSKWDIVTKYKPHILLKVMNIYKRPTVWIDADAKVEKPPVLLKEIKKDFAVHYVGNLLASGLCYFANNDVGKNILIDWIFENNTHIKTFDQINLQSVIKSKYKKNEEILPKEYLCIFDHPQYKNLDWVISQWQASRKLKKN